MPKLSIDKGCGSSEREKTPVLKGVGVKTLEVQVRLPKASLLGDGVCFKGTFGFEEGVQGVERIEGVSVYSMTLRLCDLRIPTIIGVNTNERLAKQVVVCNLEIDKWDKMVDCYCELEEIVVKVTTYLLYVTISLLLTILLDDRRILLPNP